MSKNRTSIAVFCSNLAGLRGLHALEREDLGISCVVTVSDSYLPEISKIAERQNAKLFVDVDCGDNELQKFIYGRASIGLSFSYPRLLPEELIRAFVGGAYNFHPAALPSYRGCFPTAWPIINNEPWAAYTVHKMTSRYDKGDIIDQMRIEILSGDTGWTLYLRLTDKLPEIIQRNIANLMSDSLVLNPQVESDAHYYSRKIPFDGLIQWDWTFDQIERFVRALRHPQYTGASVLLGGYKYEITDIQRIEDSRSFNIVSPEISNGVIVGRCADACLAFSVSDSTSSC